MRLANRRLAKTLSNPRPKSGITAIRGGLARGIQFARACAMLLVGSPRVTLWDRHKVERISSANAHERSRAKSVAREGVGTHFSPPEESAGQSSAKRVRRRPLFRPICDHNAKLAGQLW